MHPRSPWTALLLLAAAGSSSATSKRSPDKASSTSSTKTAVATPCVATHSTTGSFFDLRPDMASALKDGEKHRKGTPTTDYTWSRPSEWPYNFTMNVCAPVVKGVEDVVGVDKDLWQNVSAYYEVDKKVYSLGQLNTTIVPRGTQLVLRYSGGSPCALNRKDRRNSVHEGTSYKYYVDEDDENEFEVGPESVDAASTARDDDEDDEDDEDEDMDKDKGKGKGKDKGKEKEELTTRRKSAIISFRCDRDAVTTGAKLSFLEMDEDECTYMFTMLSQHACAMSEPHKPGSVGPGSVFVIIFFVAVAVYVLGGVFYQRTVANARGWKQLPNYSLWAGIWRFIQDLFVILFSSCVRLIRGRRGYRTLSSSPSGRNRNRDDENRLIDQLDEEWDD